jgi:hypothetical protein
VMSRQPLPALCRPGGPETGLTTVKPSTTGSIFILTRAVSQVLTTLPPCSAGAAVLCWPALLWCCTTAASQAPSWLVPPCLGQGCSRERGGAERKSVATAPLRQGWEPMAGASTSWQRLRIGVHSAGHAGHALHSAGHAGHASPAGCTCPGEAPKTCSSRPSNILIECVNKVKPAASAPLLPGCLLGSLRAPA